MDTARLPSECVSVCSVGIRNWERVGGGEVRWGKPLMGEREGVRSGQNSEHRAGHPAEEGEGGEGLGEKNLKWEIADPQPGRAERQ